MTRSKSADIAAVVACLMTWLGAAMALPQFDASAGKETFEKRCTGCHSLDADREGPRLRGVFGRKAATVQSFPYSGALRKSGVIWDEESLNQWLQDPDAFVPGADMAFRVADTTERGAIIAYLKSVAR